MLYIDIVQSCLLVHKFLVIAAALYDKNLILSVLLMVNFL